MRKASDDEITQAMTVGITFKKAKLKPATNENKVKTKAKKKTYITGLHGSGAAKKKPILDSAAPIVIKTNSFIKQFMLHVGCELFLFYCIKCLLFSTKLRLK